MNPILLLLIPLVMLSVLALTLRAFPNRPLVILALVPGLASILLVFLPGQWANYLLFPVIAVDGAAIVVALIDLLTLSRQKDFSVDRKAPRIASLGQSDEIELTVANHGKRDLSIWLRDDVDEELRPDPDGFVLNLRGKSRTTVHYSIRPTRRGAFKLAKVYLRVRSRVGLWQRFFEYPLPASISVYPDMKQLSKYAILARTNRLSQIGVRRTRKIGQDNEFERLRDFTRDDNFRHIDWRASARRHKLTVKDFQANQSQRIIFLLDCGRMMTNEVEGISLLDHAINSMLMLSYVALQQGDSVGLICFSNSVHTFVPPRGGRSQMNHLLHSTHDRFPQLVESRYDQAFLYLAAHCRKRALVVLMSNLIDEVNAHQVEQYLSSLVGRHLPLGVLMRDQRLFDIADQTNPKGEDLYRAGAAADIINWRQQVLADLESRGVLSLDVFPENMTAPLVNQYLNVKARHLL